MGYWKDGACLISNYRTGKTVPLTPDILRVVQSLDRWALASEVAREVALPVGATRAILRALSAATLASARSRPAAEPPDPWGEWDPAAGFFHFSTRGTRFNADVSEGERRLARKAQTTPPPAPTAVRTASVRIPLPRPQSPSPLEQLLQRRRTWRQFSRAPLALDDLADLLRLSVGVQRWARDPANRRVVLKTSPSGGICHPIEAYVIANRVQGLARGLYHYDAAGHVLARLRRGGGRPLINQFIQAQPWYGHAPLVVLFTAVFERTMWRYPVAKAYRNVLIEAGHVCQTFYLLATERGLAPFCTHAIDEDAIDAALGIDAVSEGVVYVAGCGRPPAAGRDQGLPHLDWWTDGQHSD